ncbi:Zinc finger, C2H2 type family protein [Brugia malayi]|uniref:Bm4266, isoform d n=1 Tax=Brugia malayi TaxID=6279 RepID=A0A1P6C1G4_BRUMA|nr:Zinc finger, C2H2 type family protein [Brugia malayi]CDQ05751.1 Bm4266, isoform d [Brugia malayi]VIO89786.1 Zinc finger, C2H2 type family protein [Brugia malayi]
MQNTQKTNGITKTVHTDIYDRQESVEVEETELVEESTVGQVIVGDDHEYYLILNLNGPDVDVGKVDNVQILRNDDGTETVLLEIDELNESELPSDHYRKQNDYHGVEVVDIDKHGKIMQQLFGNPAGSDPYQLGRYRRNRVYGTYSCPECDQTFINTARLERHLAVHQISGSFQCPLCQKVYKYEYNLFYHWRRTCHELSELIPAERRKTMDVNVLRSMVLKFARKKADEAPPPVMKIGINPNLLFKSDTFGLIDMQAPLSTQSVYSGVPCKQCGVKISNSVIQWHVAMHRGIIPVDARSGSGEHFCSLCGQMFRQHYSLIKHWRSSCTEIQARLSNARDISMDDETLKDMVTDIMRELGEEYSQRFGGISHDDDGEGVSAQDLFLSADKDKDLSVVDYQQDALTNRYSSHEMLTHLEAGDEAEIINHDEHSVSWSYLDQAAGDAASTSEPNPVRTKWSSTHGMVQCSVCSRTFVNMARLERHIAGFHATTGSHPCVLCGNRFKYDYNLLSHYRRSCPYTKLYIDLEKREQFDALALRRAVRALAQRNLQLSSAQKKMIANKREIPDNSPASFPHFRTRPPFELMVMRPDLPNGKSCPVCGVVFYGERAVERHVKAVHPSEVRHHIQNDTATKKDTETATSTKQRCTETREKSGNTLKQADDSDNVEPPPTLAPEVPVQEPVVTSEPIIRRVCRIEEDADGNQIFIDENGEVIELGEDEEVQIQFDDIESVQHLFETGQLTIANDEQAIILEGNLNDSKYCYNVSYGDSNSSILPTSGTRFVEGEKVADERSKRARKQEFEGNQQHYGSESKKGCYFVIHKECETDMKRRLWKRTYALH